MCNLYRMTKNASEVAAWFDAVESAAGANFAEEVYPGYTGLVVAEGAVRPMTWGFPLVLKGKQGQPLKPKPVNNARSDKLETGFWRHAFHNRRCLIPLTAWAEAQGAKGRMTRTWLSLPDAPLFAVAGVWRPSEEWGDCYSMVMTASEGTEAASVHERMPVLLAPEDHAGWLAAPAEEALGLCRGWEGPLVIDRTDQLWAKGAGSQPGLF
ncbi:SOS response-associated peptidase family protein [Porphyrobacter sp. YT40]|uniref:SOS response-associated peptidase n=1 Tax=Porphyrobacter sp. YT40 TaxID=2547601 RepID=UPI001144A188|nr:SOS response-associated peptidase family protein [Porphyrobacter sp. YT40]QDH35386.1 SOS response-associated peptidase [Porphyrobacter sp. YT40]